MKDSLVRRLKDASGRSRWLLRGVSDENLEAQHHQIMSPLIYDYGHIGHDKELWLCLSDRELYDVYDAPIRPRSEHPSFDLLDRQDADRHLDALRDAALLGLSETDL